MSDDDIYHDEFYRKEKLKNSYRNDQIEKSNRLREKRDDKNWDIRKKQLIEQHELKLEEKEKDFENRITLQNQRLNHQAEEAEKKQIVKEISDLRAEKEKTRREIALVQIQAKLAESGYRAEAEIRRQGHEQDVQLRKQGHEQDIERINLEHRNHLDIKHLDSREARYLQTISNQQEMLQLQEQGRQQQRQSEFNLRSEVLLKQLDASLNDQRLSSERFHTNALEESRHVRELESKNADLRISMVQTLAEMAKLKIKNDLEKDRFEHQQITLLRMRKLAKEWGLDYDNLSDADIAEMVAEFEEQDRKEY